MSDERATIRPITLPRLVEITHIAQQYAARTEDIEQELDVSRRRARAVILEAVRIGLVSLVDSNEDPPRYRTTEVGAKFIAAIINEEWLAVSHILETQSSHYRAFLNTVRDAGGAPLDVLLEKLEEDPDHTSMTFNQTSVDVLGDWSERLGSTQRNAFTGSYYEPRRDTVPSEFPQILLSVFDEHEASSGVNLRQRYLSIPKLREYTCERIGCTRGAFDSGLRELATRNVGRIELSGAPHDTGAKDAVLGIKQIARSKEGFLVSTSQSTDRVMSGVEHHDKQYYFLAIHDRNLTFTEQ